MKFKNSRGAIIKFIENHGFGLIAPTLSEFLDLDWPGFSFNFFQMIMILPSLALALVLCRI
jgi:hypothetical protein